MDVTVVALALGTIDPKPTTIHDPTTGIEGVGNLQTFGERNRAMRRRRNLLFWTFITVGNVLAACACFGTAAEAAETAKGMLAAQIRAQGATCGKPLSAARDAKRSGPDHEVWILRCNNAIYRVSRYPDMAAKVEQLR